MQWNLIVTAVALAAARSHALDCSASAIVNSSAYGPCQSATKIDFTSNGKTALVDPAAFCSSADCSALWGLLQRLDALQCLQRYSAGIYTLKDEPSAQSCFKTYAAPTPASETMSGTPTPTAVAHASSTTTTAAETTGKTAAAPGASDSTTTTTTASEQSTASSSSMPLSTERTSTLATTGSELSAFQLTSAATDKTMDAGAAGSGNGQANLEAATIGTVAGTNSSATSGGNTVTPPGSSVSIKADSEMQGTSMSAVWIALASCGGGVVVLIMVSIFIRRRKAKALEAKVFECLDHSGDYVPTIHSSRSDPSRRNDSASSSVSTALRTKRSPKLVCLDDDIITAVRIPYGKLTLSMLVSRGGFGEVYRGMYRNKIVAIKRLLPEKRNDVYQIENFLDEVKLMASLEHEHIVRFVGVAWETIEELCVVSEFMALGDLRTLLGKYDMDEDAHPKGFGADKLKIALHVAKALTYMHSLDPIVLHRDIKSRNILLDNELDAKVTDFGVSRERAESTMTTGVGSTLWMAPEVMTGGRYNEKADVFSFGVVLSELDTHNIPYSHVVEPGRGRRLPDTVIVQMMTMSRVRVEFTDERNSPMAQLGRRCIDLDPFKRPSAKEVEEFINEQWRSVVVAL